MAVRTQRQCLLVKRRSLSCTWCDDGECACCLVESRESMYMTGSGVEIGGERIHIHAIAR